MRGVMPSQVVAVIDEWFSHAQSPPSQNVSLNTSQFNQLQAIVRLINEIPTELIVVPVEKYSDLALALATIEVNFSHWIHKGGNFGLPRVKGRDAISVIRDVLTLCSDEYPPPATADLLFIVDVELRENIRRDIGAIERALANAEWKAANVLAGSAIEALLHWRLNQSPPTSAEIAAATGALVTSGRMQKPKTSDRDDWSLQHFIGVAGELGLIEPETVIEAKLAQNYRNLIHPGRSARLGQKCDRGTALSAVGALAHVVRDLSP
jgi:hypothetical protein